MCSFFALLLASVVAAPFDDVRFEDSLLATVPDGYELEGPSFRGPDGKTYRDIFPVVWSPDGRRVAYAGLKGGKRHPIVDDEVHDGYDFVDAARWSADGEHVVFRVGETRSRTKEKWWTLLDGDEDNASDWIGSVEMMPDGELVYWEMPGARIEKNGAYSRESMYFRTPFKKGKKWADGAAISSPIRIAQDGSWCATIAADKEGNWRVLVATKRGEKSVGPEERWIADYAVSPDGDDVALAVTDGAAPPAIPGAPPGFAPPGMGRKVVRHGTKTYGEDYDDAGVPGFTPDGEHVVLKVLKDGKMGLAFDDEDDAACEWDFVWSPVFSPDGERCAFVANDGGQVEAYWRMSSNGEHADCEGGAFWVVVRETDGDEIERFGPFEGRVEDLVLADDEDRAPAFVVADGDGFRVRCGERASEPYDEIGTLVFDEGAERVAFGARSDRELWWRVLDLTEDAAAEGDDAPSDDR